MAENKITAESYAATEDGKVSALLMKHGRAAKALPGFKVPKSRDDAIDLLVRMQVPPDDPTSTDDPPPPEEQPGEAPAAKDPGDMRFKIATPATGFGGTRCGLLFRNGHAYTDDPQIAQDLAGMGYAVSDRSKAAAK